MGRFLTRLHSFDVEQAAALGVPGLRAGDWWKYYDSWYETTKRIIWPHLTDTERRGVQSLVGGFLADRKNFTFTPALIHHDLSEDHLLVDESGQLTGVIDFGECRIGDPAFDFRGVEHLGEQVWRTYGLPADEAYRQRAAFYRRLWPIHEIRYGVEIDRADQIVQGRSKLSGSF